jgi:hypothetical protein
MFRIGGSAGTGITSGLDRKGYKDGTDEYDRALKTTERFMTDIDKFRGERGALAPLFGTATRFLGSKSGQIATGVGTGVAFGQGFNSMTGTRRTTVLTQSRRNKAKVRQLVNFMGIEGAANFLSQSMNVNVTPNDVVNLLLRTFRNDGAYITKAQVRNLRRTTNRFKSLEKQVKEATSMSRTTRRAPVRRASSTT